MVLVALLVKYLALQLAPHAMDMVSVPPLVTAPAIRPIRQATGVVQVVVDVLRDTLAALVNENVLMESVTLILRDVRVSSIGPVMPATFPVQAS